MNSFLTFDSFVVGGTALTAYIHAESDVDRT